MTAKLHGFVKNEEKKLVKFKKYVPQQDRMNTGFARLKKHKKG